MPVVDPDSVRWSTIFGGKDDLFNLPKLDRATVAGISVAIAGNILISLALNCQKLAHRRLELERESVQESLNQKTTPDRPINGSNALGVTEEENIGHSTSDDPFLSSDDTDNETDTITPSTAALLETAPLLGDNDRITPAYSANGPAPPIITTKPPWYTRMPPWKRRTEQMTREAEDDQLGSAHSLVPVDTIAVRPKGTQRENSAGSNMSNGNESDYLRSKLWYVITSPYLLQIV